MRIKLSLRDGLRARPGSARHCVIATAAERQWGGRWTVTPKGVEHVSDGGRTMKWRPSAGALVTMFLFDMGLPVPARSVRLIRGKSVPPRRVRRARRVATGAATGGVLVLAASGLAWVILVALGAVITVLIAVTVVQLRQDRRSAVPSRIPAPQLPVRAGRPAPWRLQKLGASPARPSQPGTALEPSRPSLTLPTRPEPEAEPVPTAAPKAPPVIQEPAAQLAGLTSRQPERSDA